MSVQNLGLWRMRHGLSRPQEHGPEDATQTWVEGAPVIQDGSGNVREAATEPVANILGLADTKASGITGEDRIYIPALESTIFVGNIGTSISAGAIALDDLYQRYPLQLSGTSWFVDKTDNTNPCVAVVQLIDPVGTVNGRVAFQFLQSALLSV